MHLSLHKLYMLFYLSYYHIHCLFSCVKNSTQYNNFLVVNVIFPANPLAATSLSQICICACLFNQGQDLHLFCLKKKTLTCGSFIIMSRAYFCCFVCLCIETVS